MIPPFDARSGQLPPGEHAATWAELCERFGGTAWRQTLLADLLAALRLLRSAGCRRVYLDGSFVSDKPTPGDYDGCWDAEGVDFEALDERFVSAQAVVPSSREVSMKLLGDLYMADGLSAPQGTRFREFFQRDRDGRLKGIVVIDLNGLP